MKKFKLYYGQTLVGIVSEVDFDFPNTFGEFQLISDELPDIVTDYIEYSIRAGELVESNEEEYIKYLEENENKYYELIESDAWCLIDDKNNKAEILIPNITSSGIVWRWSF